METIRFFTLPRLFELFALPFLTKAFSKSTKIDAPAGLGEFHTSPTTSTSIPSNSATPINPRRTHENCRNCLDKPDLTALNARTYTAIYLSPDKILRYHAAEGKPMPDVCNYPLDVLSRCPSSPLLPTKPVPTLHHRPPTPQNSHTTLKAIIGGVVGGFIAVILLIAVATFYRSKRLQELEDTAHPVIRIRGRNEIRNDASHPTSDERQHLYLFSLPYLLIMSKVRTVLGVTPLDPSHVSHHHQSYLRYELRLSRSTTSRAST